MTEMVERATVAARNAAQLLCLPREVWPHLEPILARAIPAAIVAMREPTDAMLAAAGSPSVFTTIGDPKLSWPAMIDAALEEKSA